MPLHTANPASARNAETGSGVFCLAAVDTQTNSAPQDATASLHIRALLRDALFELEPQRGRIADAISTRALIAVQKHGGQP
jgi:hypothetical protein